MGEEPTTEELVDAVGEDSSLTPQEKETTIHFPKDRDRATVFSAEAGIMRRLLQHPLFEAERYVPADGPAVENVEELHVPGVVIVGLKGSIPVGTLKISARARSASGHASVVSRGGSDG